MQPLTGAVVLGFFRRRCLVTLWRLRGLLERFFLVGFTAGPTELSPNDPAGATMRLPGLSAEPTNACPKLVI